MFPPILMEVTSPGLQAGDLDLGINIPSVGLQPFITLKP
jgi:hypothetical protein